VTDSAAVATACRALAQRVVHFLDLVEKEARPLTRLEADLLGQILVRLDFRIGQDARLALERPGLSRVRRPNLYGTNAARVAFGGSATVTIAKVRAELQRVLADRTAGNARRECAGTAADHAGDRIGGQPA